MEGLNLKEKKLFQLQITQTRHSLRISDAKKCLSPTPVKMRKYLTNVHKIEGAHLQCMINHYGKFEYKGISLVVVTDHTNQTLPSHFGWGKCLSPTPVKIYNYLSNVHKIDGAHCQYVNNHYAKFE